MKHSLPIFIFAQRLVRFAVIGAAIAYWLFPSAAFSQPDGLTVGLLHPRWVQRKLLGIEVPDFDLNTVQVIGSPTGGGASWRLHGKGS